jgi:hypothetical protein
MGRFEGWAKKWGKEGGARSFSNTIWIATALIVAFYALQGFLCMAQSWDAVTESTIVTCWRKCKILPIEWSGNSLDPFDSQLQNEGVELDGLIGHLGLSDNALSAKDYIQLPDKSQIDAELTTSELVALVLVSMLNLQEPYKRLLPWYCECCCVGKHAKSPRTL